MTVDRWMRRSSPAASGRHCSGKGVNVLYVDSVDDGRWLYDQVLKLDLEGVVGKWLGSTYQSGARSADWIKVKRPGAVPAKRFRHSQKVGG